LENKRRIDLKRASLERQYDLKKEFKKQAHEIKRIPELNEAVIERIMSEKTQALKEKKRKIAELERIRKEEEEELAYFKAAGMLPKDVLKKSKKIKLAVTTTIPPSSR